MPKLLTLFASILTLLLSFSLSLSSSQPLLLPLTHSLSHSNSTHLLRLLSSAALRSSARFLSRRHPHRRPVSLPLTPGSDYTLSLSVGPSTTVDLYMDTGSDLVWFPCAPFECILCEGKPRPSSPPPPPPPPSSAAVSCADAACSAAHSSLPSSDLCAVAGCPLEALETASCPSTSACPPFYYAYGDGSLVARLRRGRLVLPTAPHVLLQNFTFGCAHSALGEPVGVAGFGRGLLSLPAQLAALSPGLGAQFSYCLVAHSFQSRGLRSPSPLILGRADAGAATDEDPLVYTPMLHNPKHPYFYLVGLEAISVGGARIAAEPTLKSVDKDGNGGLVVDSGTTFTMLPSDTYDRVTAEFGRAMAALKYERAAEVEADTGLAPCYYDSKDSSFRNGSKRVPGVALHFSGGATVALPRRNYFMGFDSGGRRVGCLMVMSAFAGGDDEDSGVPAGTLGNFQQQGMEVVYDLEGRRVGFARRRCAALWDSLSRG